MIDIAVKKNLVRSILGEKLSRLEILAEDFPTFLKMNLQSEMRIQSGSKRIRKKRAKKALTSLWYWIMIERAMKLCCGHTSFGRMVSQSYAGDTLSSRDRVKGISSDYIHVDELGFFEKDISVDL